MTAAGWLISNSEKSFSTACYLLERTNATSSHRSELEGIYRTLVDIEQKKLTPSEVVHWCNNEQAVTASSAPLVSGKSLMGADANIIMAIHEQRKRLPFPVLFKHVYGHQNEKSRGKGKKDQGKKAKPKVDPTECPPLDINEGLKSQFGLGAPPMPPPKEEPEQTLQSREVQINITCDKLASATAKAVIDGGTAPSAPALTLPFAGSKAMLRIGD